LKKLKILLINSPSRQGRGAVFMPLGLIYVGGIIERCGHIAKIYDPYVEDRLLERFDDEWRDWVAREVSEFKPDIVGFGGVATSYPRTKAMSDYIKSVFPGVLQIAGGALASTAELILENTAIEVVFHGETEVSLPIFLEAIATNADCHKVAGVSYRERGEIVRTADPPQVKNLDEIPLPAYHLIDVGVYVEDVNDWLPDMRRKQFLEPESGYIETVLAAARNTKYLPILTSRGCFYACSFCYRHQKGLRRHSVQYVISHMKLLKERYGIGGFYFADEMFNSDPQWILEFCDAVEEEGLKVFYQIGGARIDRISDKMLDRLKATGCIVLSYGQESGSDTILKELRKGVTSWQNFEGTVKTMKKGIIAPVSLVVGSPSETNETIRETIAFLKKAKVKSFCINYLIALPKTPVWEYAKSHNLIPDEEAYLQAASRLGGEPNLNLTKTDYIPWRNWGRIITLEMEYSHPKTSLLTKLFLRLSIIYLYHFSVPKVAVSLYRKFRKRR